MTKAIKLVLTSPVRAAGFGAGLAIGLAAQSSVIAADISPAGADQVRQQLERYVGKPDAGKPGYVTVAPDGKRFRVSFNLQHALDLIPAAAGTIEASPLVFSLEPLADGTWKVTLSDKAKVDYATASQSGSYAAENILLDAIFDPALAAFRTSNISVGLMNSTANNREATATASIANLQQTAVTTATPGGTVDIAITQSTGEITETVNVSMPKLETPASMVPMKIDVKIASEKSTYQFNGLRSHQLLDLWAFAVANSGPKPQAAQHPDYKPLLLAALPVLDSLKLQGNLERFAVGTPYGIGSIGSYAANVDLSTQSPSNSAHLGLQLDDIKIASAFVTEPFASLVPTKVSIDLAAKDFDFNSGMKTTIDGYDFVRPDPDYFDKNKDKITSAWLPSGKFKVDLGPSTISAPIYSVAWQGTVEIEHDTGKLHLDAQMAGFDAMLKALAQAKQPGVAQALVGLYAVQALAKKNPDGTLTWAIDADDSGFQVNGKPVGPQKKRDL